MVLPGQTTMEGVVAPVLHEYDVAPLALAVSVMHEPEQIEEDGVTLVAAL